MTLPPHTVDELSARDRAVQAAAVEYIAMECTTCDEALHQLWKSTDRFDVRQHIVQVLEARGEAGISDVWQLASSGPQITNDYGVRNLLLRALAAHADHAVEILIESPDQYGSGGVYFASLLLQHQETNPAPVISALLGAKSPKIRSSVFYHLVPMLPQPARASVQLSGARDQDTDVRTAAMGTFGLGAWAKDDQENNPEAYAEFIRTLEELVQSEDDRVTQKAINSLIANEANGSLTASKLEAIFGAETREFWTRADAMKAYLKVHQDKQQAIVDLLELIEEHPHVVCIALATIDPDQIPEAVFPLLLETIPRAGSREINYAHVLFAPHGYQGRNHIGIRAMPALLEAISSEGPAHAGAVGVLRALGPEAIEAVPALLELLETSEDVPSGVGYASALVAIAPDSLEVQRALTKYLQSELSDLRSRYSAGELLRELLRMHPEEDWVRELVDPAIASEEHPLHQYVARYPPKEVSDVLAVNEEDLVERLLATPVRDRAWAFAQGELDSEPDTENPSAHIPERDRRQRALQGLRLLTEPSDAVFQALITTLSSDILDKGEPDRTGKPGTAAYSRSAKAGMTWYLEEQVASEAGNCLATLVERRPEWLVPTLEQLSDHPRGLALLLSGYISTPDGRSWTHLELPQDLPAPLATKCLYALIPYAQDAVNRYDNREITAIGQLGRIPTEDPRQVEVLMGIAQYGTGTEGTIPGAALSALGSVRPVTPEIVAFVDQHLHHVHPNMQRAAVSAFGKIGPGAEPYLDKILQLGRKHLKSSTGSVVARAVQEIAPDDPRVISFVADHKEAHRRPAR